VQRQPRVWSSAGLENLFFFLGRLPKLSINMKENFWPAHGNFEEHNKILEPSVIIINY